MRALSPNQEPDSRESNMMLALESARAIGCHIGEDSTTLIDRGEPQAIRQLVMDIVRVGIIIITEILLKYEKYKFTVE